MSEQYSASDFYNGLGDRYDSMTRFESRLDRERVIIRKWVERTAVKSALDLACGTGVHAIALAELGVRAVGIDISASMIESARLNAAAHAVTAQFIIGKMASAASLVKEKFDAVLCLGNSIPHLLIEEELVKTLDSIRRVLQPRGTATIQLLNYERVLADKNRIVGVHRVGDMEFVRFYDFLGENIRFNILITQHGPSGLTHEIHSTELKPYTRVELEDSLARAGFTEIQQYSNLDQEPFFPAESTDLVLVARRSD